MIVTASAGTVPDMFACNLNDGEDSKGPAETDVFIDV